MNLQGSLVLPSGVGSSVHLFHVPSVISTSASTHKSSLSVSISPSPSFSPSYKYLCCIHFNFFYLSSPSSYNEKKPATVIFLYPPSQLLHYSTDHLLLHLFFKLLSQLSFLISLIPLLPSCFPPLLLHLLRLPWPPPPFPPRPRLPFGWTRLFITPPPPLLLLHSIPFPFNPFPCPVDSSGALAFSKTYNLSILFIPP